MKVSDRIIRFMNAAFRQKDQSDSSSLSVKSIFNRKQSPLDVKGVDVGITREEILTFIKEVRKR
jgi:hypothetical protein